MAKQDPIDIPPEALETKVLWAEHPGWDVVGEIEREVLVFVAETGKPYMWRGHTHTKPPEGADVQYWGEFDIPEWHVLDAPCPCCVSLYPKYRWRGKIAFFPNEGVIRLIGPDCFAKLNKEGHDEALAAFRARKADEKAISYLLTHLPVVPHALTVLRAAMPVAHAIDSFRKELDRRLRQSLAIDVWRWINFGHLIVETTRREVFRTRAGEEGIRKVDDHADYGYLRGHDMLAPRYRPFEPRLRRIVGDLEAIAFSDCSSIVDGMNGDERKRVARTLDLSFDKGRRLIDEMSSMREFVGPIAVATLRSWSKHPRCPIAVRFDRQGDKFLVGKIETAMVRIDIPKVMEERLGELPRLGWARVQARASQAPMKTPQKKAG